MNTVDAIIEQVKQLGGAEKVELYRKMAAVDPAVFDPIEQFIGVFPSDGPMDWIKNHDHYIGLEALDTHDEPRDH